MVTINDLITDWERMRATLKQQLEMLESGKMHTGGRIADTTTAETIARVKNCLHECDALLAAYASETK